MDKNHRVEQRLLWTVSLLNLRQNCIPGHKKGIVLSFGVFYVFLTWGKHVAAGCRCLQTFGFHLSFRFSFLQMSACMKTFLKLVSSEILPWSFKETYGVSFSAPLEASHLHFRWRYECAFIPTQNICNFSSGNIFAVCLVAAVAQGIKWQEKISHTKEDTPAWHQFSLPVPRSHTPKQTAPRRKTCCRNSTRQMQEETTEGETLEKISIQNGPHRSGFQSGGRQGVLGDGGRNWREGKKKMQINGIIEFDYLLIIILKCNR